MNPNTRRFSVRPRALVQLRPEDGDQPGRLPDSFGARRATSIESFSPAGSSEVSTLAGRAATVSRSTLPTNFHPTGILTNTKPVGGSTKTAKSWTLIDPSSDAPAVWAATGRARAAAAIRAKSCFFMVLSPRDKKLRNDGCLSQIGQNRALPLFECCGGAVSSHG